MLHSRRNGSSPKKVLLLNRLDVNKKYSRRVDHSMKDITLQKLSRITIIIFFLIAAFLYLWSKAFNPHPPIVYNKGFAACLIVKNDNEKLAEWIAYHWLVLPLRYLIVAVDPASTTSPIQVLQRWQEKNIGLEILLWGDEDFNHVDDPSNNLPDRFVMRQVHFYRQCMHFHKDKGRTWVSLVDNDEFLTFNHYNDDQGEEEGDFEYFDETPLKFKNSTYVKEMQKMRKELPNLFPTHRRMFKSKPETTILDYILSHEKTFENCHLLSRLFFSSIEMNLEDERNIEVQFGKDLAYFSKAFDGSFSNHIRFRTLRYFHHQAKNKWLFNAYGKVIVDVSKIDYDAFTFNKDDAHFIYLGNSGPHNPLGGYENLTICSKPLIPHRTSILRANHYLSS